MIKRILHLLSALLLLLYMAFAVAFINPKAGNDRVCTGIEIEIAAAGEASYLNRSQIEAMLSRSRISPAGRKLSEIRTDAIEKTLQENKLIKKAEVCKTIDGRLKICVYQRIPVLRIMPDGNRSSYYVDREGYIMPVPPHYAAHVPLATGAISDHYAVSSLYPFAEFLRKEKEWSHQFVQIHVLPNQDVELTPRKGNHSILLGKIENYRENLDKLTLFYKEGLDKVGWNKYSQINLKYKNQVVCTKRK
jgi:cell division protein FtsQ